MLNEKAIFQLIELCKKINKMLENENISSIKSFVPEKNSKYCDYIGFNGYSDEESLELCRLFTKYLIDNNYLNAAEEINRKINSFCLSSEKSFEFAKKGDNYIDLVDIIKEIHSSTSKNKNGVNTKERKPSFS